MNNQPLILVLNAETQNETFFPQSVHSLLSLDASFFSQVNFSDSLPRSTGPPQLRGLHGPNNGSNLTCKVLGKLYCLTTLHVTFLSSTHGLNRGLNRLQQQTQSLMKQRLVCNCSQNTLDVARQLSEVHNVLQLYVLWMNTTIPLTCHKMEHSKPSC